MLNHTALGELSSRQHRYYLSVAGSEVLNKTNLGWLKDNEAAR